MGRRRFLALAGGAAGAAGLAGCSGVIGNDPEAETSERTGTGSENATETTGTAEPTETTTDSEDDGMEFPVTVTQGQFPPGLDPHAHRQTPADNVLLHCYEGVLAQDRHGRIVEGLATNYERLQNGNAVRFEIREDVSFHDGSTLAPEDVAYSVNRVVDESTGFRSPQRGQLNGVSGASVVDGEPVVEVTSSGINPVVFSAFASYCDVLSKQWMDEHDHSYLSSHAMGTGPFVLDSFEEGRRVVMSRFDDYWNEPAEVTEVTFTAETDAGARVDSLLNGESTVVTDVPPAGVGRINDSRTARVASTPSARILFAAMRHDVKPFDSATFRRAMNLAVDLTSVVENVLQGFGEQTGQPTPEGFTGHDSDVKPYPYDPEQAEQLVEESGYAGAELTLHVPVGRYLKGVEIAQSVAGYVDELSNVSATVERREFQSLASDLLSPTDQDDPAWYLAGWGEPTMDGAFVMRPLLSSTGRLSTWSNDEFDQLLERASTRTGDERANTLREANKLAHDRTPWIFLNRQYSVYGVSADVAWEPRRDERLDAYEMSRTN